MLEKVDTRSILAKSFFFIVHHFFHMDPLMDPALMPGVYKITRKLSPKRFITNRQLVRDNPSVQ